MPFRASLRGGPTRDGVQTPKVSKPTNTGGGDDDGVGGHGSQGHRPHRTGVYLDGDHADGFTHDYNGSHLLSQSRAEWQNVFPAGGFDGPYWRAEWWAQVPISKRGAQLRDTRNSERRDDFDSADKGGAGDALPEPR